MLRALGRLILITLGLVLGAAATSFILFTLGMERVTKALYGRDVDVGAWTDAIDALGGLMSLASAATLVPVLLLVIVGEVGRIRSVTYYIFGGGVALAILPFLARVGTLGDGMGKLGMVWQIFATAGFVGGFVYWLVAGRRA